MIVFNNSDPVEVNEGDGQVTIEINPIASGITEPVAVEITTIDGSALSTSFTSDATGLDFSSVENSIVTLDPDNTDSLSFSIDLTDDSIVESDEEFQFQVTGIEDEELEGITSIVIIDDDDEEIAESELVVADLLPEITIEDVEQLEGDSGITSFVFTVSLDQASEELVTVDFFTSDSSAESEDQLDGLTLIDPADYIPLDGTLEFAPGETEKTIVVDVLTDEAAFASEGPEETFLLVLTNPTNADLDQLAATGTIIDDDLKPEVDQDIPFIQVENQFFVEGDINEETEQNVTVSLVDIDGEPVEATADIDFSFGTVDVTASANVDYKFVTDEMATIEAGESSTSVSITIVGDTQTEPDEKLLVVFSELDFDLVRLKDDGTELTTEITIVNDDAISDSDLADAEELDDGSDAAAGDDVASSLAANQVFRFFDSETGAYFYTDSTAERESIEVNKPNFIQEESSFASVAADSTDDEVDVFQFFNSETGGYLYTSDVQERDFISENSSEFVFEGTVFSAFETEIGSAIPVYRFFETNAGVHFYTANEAEKAFIEENLPNFDFEGIAFFGLPLESDIASS